MFATKLKFDEVGRLYGMAAPGFIDNNVQLYYQISKLINAKAVIILSLCFIDYIRRFNCKNPIDVICVILAMCWRYIYKPVHIAILRVLKCLYNGLPIIIMAYIHMLNIDEITRVNPSLKNPGPNQISVLYSNIQGMIHPRDLASIEPPLNMTKIHEINAYLIANKPEILILNETWLKKVIKNKQLLPNIYKIKRLDRSVETHPYDINNPKKFRKHGGGIAIAHRRDMKIEGFKFTKCSVQAEILTINFKLDNGKILSISTFYRVGNLGPENLQHFKKYMTELALANKMAKHIIIGDFNFPELNWPDSSTSCQLHEDFINFIVGDLGHSQLISEPTHKSGNILDLLFTNIPNQIKDIHVMDKDKFCRSDHFGIEFCVDIAFKYKPIPKRKIFNYNKADYQSLNNDIRSVNWDHVFSCNDPCIAWDRFKKILADFCNKRIPKRTIRSQFQPPWYDTECDQIRRKKEKLRLKAKGSGLEKDYERFREIRKKLKNTMNAKMRLNFIDDSDSSLISKKFWNYQKSKSKSIRIPETVRYGDRFRSNSKDQAELFNEYFSHQFSGQSKYDLDFDCSGNSFIELYFEIDEVYQILKELNPSKAAGPDGIHGNVLKNCARSLAYPLSILFNLSYVTGCIPPDWKLASVVPVFKKGDKKSVENYRPISLTSLVMKVFERSIKKVLLNSCKNLLDTRQHGFLNDRSCDTQMIPFIQDLTLSLNDKCRTDIIYFDFAKAFDSVSHDLILYKLKHEFNINGLLLRFIKAYLEGRLQHVVVGGFTSSSKPVHSGVPQGSILGPLLFVLFINDMFLCITDETNIALYADDTKIWRRINSFNDHHLLQNDIKNLFDWSVKNQMVFHPSKCKALSISKKRNIFDNLPFNVFIYEMNGTLIDYVEAQRDLGVMVDSKLNWNSQYSMVLSNSISKLGILKRTCHFTTDARQKRSFYIAIVRSLFEHCSTIWSPQHKTNLSKFASLQRRAVKWINGEQFVSYTDEKYYEVLRKHNILPMKLKFIYNDLVMFFKIVNKLLPVDFPDYITVCEPGNSRFTRSTASIHNSNDTTKFSCSIQPNCDAFKYSFFYRTMLRWNHLPIDIRNAENLGKFKSMLKQALWSPDTEWPD